MALAETNEDRHALGLPGDRGSEKGGEGEGTHVVVVVGSGAHAATGRRARGRNGRTPGRGACETRCHGRRAAPGTGACATGGDRGRVVEQRVPAQTPGPAEQEVNDLPPESDADRTHPPFCLTDKRHNSSSYAVVLLPRGRAAGRAARSVGVPRPSRPSSKPARARRAGPVMDVRRAAAAPGSMRSGTRVTRGRDWAMDATTKEHVCDGRYVRATRGRQGWAGGDTRRPPPTSAQSRGGVLHGRRPAGSS